jgi:hypothetical protein
MIGPVVMDAQSRKAMKEQYFEAFNKPVQDGSHLLKTWKYLEDMGIGDDVELRQREAIDHIRAWKGRKLIYGAIWDRDCERLFMSVGCAILVACARDDVLWKYFGRCTELRPDVLSEVIEGGNFELDVDADGIERIWSPFLERVGM